MIDRGFIYKRDGTLLMKNKRRFMLNDDGKTGTLMDGRQVFKKKGLWFLKDEAKCSYKTLDMELIECFTKRNIKVISLTVEEGASKYTIKCTKKRHYIVKVDRDG